MVRVRESVCTADRSNPSHSWNSDEMQSTIDELASIVCEGKLKPCDDHHKRYIEPLEDEARRS